MSVLPPPGPRLLHGGLVLVDPGNLQATTVLPLQYNPDTVTRTVTPQASGRESADHLEALRLTGPPEETIRVEIEIDATAWLDAPGKSGLNDVVARYGLLPQLSAYEVIVSPMAADLMTANQRSAAGVLEIAPVLKPLTLFVWGRQRVVPVRLTDFTVTEEAFDSSLNPMRARVVLAMHVLTTSDLGVTGPGDFYLQYQRRREHLAGLLPNAGIADVGLSHLRGG